MALLVLLLLALSGSPDHVFAPLADAAEKRDTRHILSLLKHGANVNAAQVDGTTALHWAAYYDDLSTAKSLIAAHARLDASNRYGVRPLSLACVTGDSGMVELLL